MRRKKRNLKIEKKGLRMRRKERRMEIEKKGEKTED